MQLEGHGEDKYKYPKLAMSWPYGRWANDKNIACFINIKQKNRI